MNASWKSTSPRYEQLCLLLAAAAVALVSVGCSHTSDADKAACAAVKDDSNSIGVMADTLQAADDPQLKADGIKAKDDAFGQNVYAAVPTILAAKGRCTNLGL